MTKPIVSKDFNLEDIRKIREYNSLRHVQMTPREIIEDTRKGAVWCGRVKRQVYDRILEKAVRDGCLLCKRK